MSAYTTYRLQVVWFLERLVAQYTASPIAEGFKRLFLENCYCISSFRSSPSCVHRMALWTTWLVLGELSRHQARFPLDHRIISVLKFIKKIQYLTDPSTKYSPPVMYDAWSERRRSACPAISLGWEKYVCNINFIWRQHNAPLQIDLTGRL